ncbi:hypothetical protein [Clostridium tertium]|uniref:hypothetical protein n=1 Tax=Clostridium tertium TaxID=1559 RepID=UPI00206878AB|nr:MAG TPA: Major capsid protein [Caudoviricetes sp.]
MFLKNLRMSRLMEADSGASSGANTGDVETTETNSDTKETTQEEKTFTQADVDKLIQERIAREKKNQLSKEELKAYNEWKESQKTEEEKKNEALTNAEKARLAAEEKATALEAKVTCLSKGVIATSVDDVVILAKAMVTEEVAIEQAIDKVLEKYPSFKGEHQQEEQNKGFKVGAGAEQTKGNTNDALASIFGNK